MVFTGLAYTSARTLDHRPVRYPEAQQEAAHRLPRASLRGARWRRIAGVMFAMLVATISRSCSRAARRLCEGMAADRLHPRAPAQGLIRCAASALEWPDSDSAEVPDAQRPQDHEALLPAFVPQPAPAFSASGGAAFVLTPWRPG